MVYLFVSDKILFSASTPARFASTGRRLRTWPPGIEGPSALSHLKQTINSPSQVQFAAMRQAETRHGAQTQTKEPIRASWQADRLLAVQSTSGI